MLKAFYALSVGRLWSAPKVLAKADCPHGKRVREQAKIDAEKRRAVHKYSWYSELDEEAREVLDKEHIAQLDGMKEIERESQIAQLVEEKSTKKKQQQLKALAISSKEKGKTYYNRHNTKTCFFSGPATVIATALATTAQATDTATAKAKAFPATALPATGKPRHSGP